MKCKPDVVLKNKINSERLIIERKTTYLDHYSNPEKGWPNVEAQLWCYSNIDNWRNCPKITLIGQYWKRIPAGLQLLHNHSIWFSNDTKHKTKCELWFKKYGGKIIN